jgi:hypothetical protein
VTGKMVHVVALVWAVTWTALSIPCVMAEESRRIVISNTEIGFSPRDFEFTRTGEGDLGEWTVSRDQTSPTGVAIEHVSTDQTEDRFPLAIYTPVVAENVEVSVRFKIISGTFQSAGIALGLRDSSNYYAVCASALEHRLDLLLFTNSKIERIGTADAEVMLNHWHALTVKVNDDHFSISFDRQALFTTFDRTRIKDGRVALWTQEDNVTRFDELEIRPLANPGGQ